MNNTRTILVVGGGLVGLATALKLARKYPGYPLAVLEKEPGVGMHQSTHNSGVLHCGLYYKPGSLKARLAVAGIQEMTGFCRQYGIPHEICGKVVVATHAEELPRLEELHRRGQANGLQGLRVLTSAQLREIEPHVHGISALHVPQEGIADYAAVCAEMVRLIRAAGGAVHTNCHVLSFRRDGPDWIALSSQGEFRGTYLLNCAGLHCDRVAKKAGARPPVKIVPFRGEYYKLRPERQSLVRHLIYPVPDPAFPFLGVHFTRLISGGVECGPNAVLAFAREGYSLSRINFIDLADSLSYPGLWAFLRKYPKVSFKEFVQSFSRASFCGALQRLVPEIRAEDLAPGGAGVRAQAMSLNGDLVQDFSLLHADRALHVLNAPSPAATASLAIGSHLADQITL